MTRRVDVIDRMKDVGHEYEVAALTMALLSETLRENPSFLNRHGLRNRDAFRWQDNLEATYLVRLFAVFESGLREPWRNAFRKKSRPGMEVLLAKVMAIQEIPLGDFHAADAVRRYRNQIIHDGEHDATEPVAIKKSRGDLCRYFSRLPLHW